MSVSLQAKKRDNLSRGFTKQLRKEGKIPAVVYGKNQSPVTVSVDQVELLKTVRDEGRNAIISLNIEGGDTVDVMLHDYQADPVKDQIIHADFYAVDLSEEIDVHVPIRLEGEAMGVKEGGVLQQPLYEIEIRVKPREIPDDIVVDVTDLKIGDSISVADLPSSEQYEYLDDPETVIVSIVPPDTADDIAPATDEDIEPELVGAEEQTEEE